MPFQSQIVVAVDLKAEHRLKCQLFIQALRSYGCASLRVIGTSMWPSLWPGDTVEIRAASLGHIDVGELVAFTREDRIFVHRAIRCCTVDGMPALITRGDALRVEDTPVFESELLGIARLTEKTPRSLLRRLRRTFHLIRS